MLRRARSCSSPSFFFRADVVVAPSAVHVDHVRQIAKPEIAVAAQNSYIEASGAFTGENRCGELQVE